MYVNLAVFIEFVLTLLAFPLNKSAVLAAWRKHFGQIYSIQHQLLYPV